ncbi:MAG: HAD family hydrolase, partial [Acidobacteria bacterium]|nr:HAD family hydrolase [Acidobacteriota bacterium]
MIRCILFDLDGTLLDSYGPITESLNAARAAFGLAGFTREEVVHMVGHGLEQLMAQVLGEPNVAEGIRIFRERYQVVSLPKSRLLPGVEPTVRELSRRGYRMAVVTNKPALFSRRILQHLGVSELFPVLYGPDLAPAKPNPEMIFRCLQDFACDSREAILVGDMLVDQETARNAGIPFFAVSTGSESRENLLSAQPQRLLDKFEDLLVHLP